MYNLLLFISNLKLCKFGTKNLKMKYFFYALVALFLFSCQETSTTSQPKEKSSIEKSENPKQKLIDEVKVLEKKLMSSKDKELDKPTAYELIAKSEAWVNQYPDHPQTPDVAFKAADVARGLGDFGLAIKLWEKVYQKYPDYKKAPEALFLMAFTYENDVNQPKIAKKYFEKFITLHPKHELVPQVKTVLKNIGKSPEELIKSFQNKAN